MMGIAQSSSRGSAASRSRKRWLKNVLALAIALDIFQIEQFIALNLYEMSRFLTIRPSGGLKDFVTRYNEIIDEVETDPSLRIELSV